MGLPGHAMRRLVVAPDRLGSETLALDAAESRYLRNVLRMKAGDPIELRDGAGHRCTGRLADKRTIQLGPLEALPPDTGVAVHLCFAPPKHKRLDLLLEKAVELGAAALHPVYCERSVRRDSAEERWLRVVREAARQCAAARTPELSGGRPLRALIESPPAVALRLVADPEAPDRLGAVLPDAVDSVAVLTGPEGGLTAAELEAATAAGWRPFRLGDRILRAETAPIAALAILRHRFGDL